jgi:preprotein translocase subunit SecA
MTGTNVTKKVSKSEIIKLVNQSEMLDAITQTIDRNDSTSKKQSDLNRVIQDIKDQIKDDRDILIIAIRIR